MCCKDFKKSQQPCTDNEGFGRLIKRDGFGYSIGTELEQINYCPWCGKKINGEKNESISN